MLDRERTAIIAELTPPFVIQQPPEQTVPLVFCSPHSGRIYPSIFLATSRLDAQSLRKSEDCFVDELFDCVPQFGAPLISAQFPRAYLDVNREPYELDPELFDGPLPNYANSQTMRVVGGLGTVARVVSDSEPIYDGPIALDVGLERIERLYKPFHSALKTLIEATRDKFGYAILIDCHSMPSSSSNYPATVRPDIIIGDRFGTSCDGQVTRLVRQALSAVGRQIQLNRPYAGGFITEYYGQPEHNVHAVQIEINRGLYLNEARFERSRSFGRLRRRIASFVSQLIGGLPIDLSCRDAAE